MRLFSNLAIATTIIFTTNLSLVFADATVLVDANHEQVTMFVKNNKVLIKSVNYNQNALFDSAKQTLYLIDHDNKTVTPLDQETIEQLSGQLAGAVSMVNDQLKNLPPEQRAQMEAMMGNMGISMPKSQPKQAVSFNEIGKEAINGIKCMNNEVKLDGVSVGSACLSNAGDTQLSDADYEALISTQSFMLKIAKEAQQLLQQPLPQLDPEQFSGLVINSQINANADVPAEAKNASFSVTKIVSGDVSESMELPEGYRKESIESQIPNVAN